MLLIFDLDMTLVDSKIADDLRSKGLWHNVYQCIPEFTLFDGVREALCEIESKAIAYAIVTSSPRTYCEKVIHYFNFHPFDIVCYHDTKRHKPFPDPITYALTKGSDRPKENVLSFGDKDTDIYASNHAGVMSVACLWGASERTRLLESSPDFMIHHPYEALHIIELIENEEITP